MCEVYDDRPMIFINYILKKVRDLNETNIFILHNFYFLLIEQ